MLSSEDAEYRLKGKNELGKVPEQERFESEKEVIQKKARELLQAKINPNKNLINAEDHLGIRCLSLLEDGEYANRAKLLHGLFRSEPIFNRKQDIKGRADSYLMQKYPITSSSLISKPAVAKTHGDPDRGQEEGRAQPTDVLGPQQQEPLKLATQNSAAQ